MQKYTLETKVTLTLRCPVCDMLNVETYSHEPEFHDTWLACRGCPVIFVLKPDGTFNRLEEQKIL